jgi:hypothetical protein
MMIPSVTGVVAFPVPPLPSLSAAPAALQAEARLAAPLPAPPPDVRLLAAAGLLLAVAVLLVWRAAARLRRAPAAGSGPREVTLQELSRVKARTACPCRDEAVPAAGRPAGRRLCADRVHALLLEFAAAATGLPCATMTTEEMRGCVAHLPPDLRAACARLIDILAAADLERFAAGASSAVGGCLVDAAAAALQQWPAQTVDGPAAEGGPELP